ncbi:MAG: hypothetical protein KDA21_02945 [Phycisphaerales bacterium]|nr:hypothetical protein [Phycisphaerales bacterium]
MSTGASYGALAGLVSAGMVVAVAGDAEATRISAGVPVMPEPFWHSSYVSDGGGLGIRLKDLDYATILDRYTGGDEHIPSRYLSVDIVSNICFGGGFLNEIDALPLEYTFASATGWWQGSYTHEDILESGDVVVDNFTRGYRWALDQPMKQMIEYFNAAALGPAGIRDPFAPPSVYPPAFENPQYGSSDPVLNGPNDMRAVGGAQQYVIMVVWGRFEARHLINVSRMRSSLLANGVPPGNIVQLWGLPQDPNPPLAAGPWASVLPSDPGPAGLGAIGQTTGTTPFHFEAAVDGVLFTGVFPLATNGARLLIYNTGHGGHALSIPIWQIYRPIYGNEGGGGMGGSGVGRGHGIPIGGQQTPGESDGWHDSTTSTDGYDTVQITFDTSPDPDVTLWINGIDYGPLDDYAITPGTEYTLDPYVSGPQVHYQLPVHKDVLGCTASGLHPLCDPENMDLRFYGMDPETASVSPRLLSVRVRRGDGETLAVLSEHELIPAPCYGDANGDRTVDFSDLNLVLGNWGATTSAGDLNSDGIVNFTDLNLILLHWGETCP